MGHPEPYYTRSARRDFAERCLEINKLFFFLAVITCAVFLPKLALTVHSAVDDLGGLDGWIGELAHAGAIEGLTQTSGLTEEEVAQLKATYLGSDADLAKYADLVERDDYRTLPAELVADLRDKLGDEKLRELRGHLKALKTSSSSLRKLASEHFAEEESLLPDGYVYVD